MPDGRAAFADPPPDAVRPGAVPFDQAIAFFRAKLNLPTRTWTDLWQDQHAAAFMVAGAMKADLIQDLRDAVDRALADGTTLADFRRDFAAIVQRHGWSYRGQFGWRTRTIFETNLRMAYAAGKWQQAQATRADFPYLRYVAVLDDRTRPDHRRWHGTILPLDDPWWQTHYPPNGWGCRCTVQRVGDDDLKRRGWVVQPEGPRDPLVSKPVRDIDGTRTMQVPRGIDPGFAYNVGAASQGATAAQAAAAAILRKYETWPAAIGAAVAREIIRSPAFARFFEAPAGAPFVVGALPDAVRQAIGAAQRSVLLSAETLVKQKTNHPDLTIGDYAALPDLLEAPDFAAGEGPGNQIVIVRRVGRLFYLAVKTTGDRSENYVLSFRRTSAADLRALRRRARPPLIGDLEMLIRAAEEAETARR